MLTKTMTSMALALMFAGAAAAQTTGATDPSDKSGSGPAIKSATMQQFLEDNPRVVEFFTDEELATLRSDEEIKTAFLAMDEGERLSLQEACVNPYMTEEAFSRGILSLCTRIEGY